MLNLLDTSGMRLCDGFSRRDWLKIGSVALGGLSLPTLLARQATAKADASPQGSSFGKAKSVIVFGLVGGPPQHETFDPKPDAPAEIRGQFGVIPSKTPGLKVGELLPRIAGLTDKFAVLRAIVTGDNAHSSSGYQMLTGVPHIPLNQEDRDSQGSERFAQHGGTGSRGTQASRRIAERGHPAGAYLERRQFPLAGARRGNSRQGQ